jgi:hypothetical protein
MARSGTQLLLFGGASGPDEINSDAWLLSGTNWGQLMPPAAPEPRTGAAASWVGGRIILFGGSGGSGGYFGDTWAFDGNGWTQLVPAVSPSRRAFAGMDSDSTRIVMFGGMSASGDLNDTWTFDGSTWTQIQTPTTPQARSHHSLAFGSAVIVLFGGVASSEGAGELGTSGAPLGDTWTFNGTTWNQSRRSPGPSARRDAALASLSYQVFLYGGADSSGAVLADDWTFDSSDGWVTWQPENGPPALTGAMFAFNWGLSEPVLFGGYNSQTGYSGATWRYGPTSTSSTWFLIQQSGGPPPRMSGAMAADPYRGTLVLFGGQGPNGVLGDTWVFANGAWTQWQPSYISVDVQLDSVTYQPPSGSASWSVQLAWTVTRESRCSSSPTPSCRHPSGSLSSPRI